MPAEDPVVVGIDGGDLDQALLRWAAEEAKARKARLVVCHVWEESDADGAPQPVGEEPVTEPTAPERLLRTAVGTVRSWMPDLEVSAVLAHGRATPALLGLSERARILVVGARGAGRLQLGSVSTHVAMHAHCPAAVVQPPSTSNAVDVVAGVDDWPESDRTVRLAADEAQRFGGKLVLLHAYRLPGLAEYGPNAGIDEPHHRAAAEEVVERAADTVRTTDPDMDIEPKVVHGPAADRLLDAAADAAALVVGARGRGGFTGLLLGSVSQHVLRRAPCTVVVVR